ncbi:DNA-binding MarR family transcriptional regulator [Murinocardiopsis flavida]|uniref:DNA-binding MarR family transcriptional regulator n=1 Tax=Murinocardiopsis flavida TaxID=645275 RepID=A0A2P8DMR5_9ACTN|nr:MarR family winged helix-turn-helix transcriptional regulator [Murinocardiopsis flavida]PSK98511.1 DNA-binding MarR family transcriptional regulator [Murinocardiopsis flavida]
MSREDPEFTEFLHAWGDLMNAVAHARARSTVADAPKLTLPQALLLETVRAQRRPTVGTIAAAAGIASPSATRMLQQLERKGAVRRRRSDEDERITVITLTDEGAVALDECWAGLRARQHQLFDGVDPALRPALIELLRSMRDVVDTM